MPRVDVAPIPGRTAALFPFQGSTLPMLNQLGIAASGASACTSGSLAQFA